MHTPRTIPFTATTPPFLTYKAENERLKAIIERHGDISADNAQLRSQNEALKWEVMKTLAKLDAEKQAKRHWRFWAIFAFCVAGLQTAALILI